MVMGPTPPGTGVIEPATVAQWRNHNRQPAALAIALDAVDADIDDAGAGLHQSPFTIRRGQPRR